MRRIKLEIQSLSALAAVPYHSPSLQQQQQQQETQILQRQTQNLQQQPLSQIPTTTTPPTSLPHSSPMRMPTFQSRIYSPTHTDNISGGADLIGLVIQQRDLGRQLMIEQQLIEQQQQQQQQQPQPQQQQQEQQNQEHQQQQQQLNQVNKKS
jgi:hypothetical protein